MTVPLWMAWVRRLSGIANAGLAWGSDPYDLARYRAVRELAAEIAAVGSHTPLAAISQALSAEVGYLTPKIDVRGAVFDDDERVLLVRERADGKWSLPGGWADPGESPSEAVQRELREESGYDVRVRKLVALFERDRHHSPPLLDSIWKLFFLCEPVAAGPRESEHEIAHVAFFALNALPANLSSSRVTSGQIHLMAEHRRRPHLPTTFD
jgi:ADP-ribose pyrophosphatase YjhB (NUDIX family)